jgi:hypothetical protein
LCVRRIFHPTFVTYNTIIFVPLESFLCREFAQLYSSGMIGLFVVHFVWFCVRCEACNVLYRIPAVPSLALLSGQAPSCSCRLNRGRRYCSMVPSHSNWCLWSWWVVTCLILMLCPWRFIVIKKIVWMNVAVNEGL